MYSEYYIYKDGELELKRKISKSAEENFIAVTSLKVPDPTESIEEIEGFEPFEENPKFIEKEKNIFKNGINVIREVSHISIDEIFPFVNNYRIFKEYSKEMQEALQNSIASNGLLSPIILWEHINGGYIVISGFERLKAFKELHEDARLKSDEDLMNKYKKIPSFVLKRSEITSMNAKHIYIDSNLCTRSIDGESRVRAYSEYYMILKYFKEKRNEYNLIDKIATKFRTSKQTVCNYLSLNKLIEPLMYLFQEKVISFKSALKLSKFKVEYQEKIVEVIGLKNINNTRIEIINLNAKSEREFLNNLQNAKNCKYPFKTSLRINLPTKHIEEFVPELFKFLRKYKKYFVKLIVPKIKL